MDATPRPGPRGAPRWLWLLGALLVLLLAAVALQVPAPTPTAGGTPDGVDVIAHGGAQGHAPADTIAAFDLALEQGAEVLEMDLQLTADGHLVTHHDGTVDRTTDGTGTIAEMALAEVQALDAGWAFTGPDGGHPWRGRGVVIPTFDEVLARYPDVPMIVELKTDGGTAIIDPAIERVREHGRDDGSLVLASFSRDHLDPVRAALPDVPTNMPESETTAFYVRQLVGLHPWWTPPGEYLQVPEVHEGRQVVTPRFVDAAERLGVQVQVWTVNDPEQMHRLLDAGVHGIMTDVPDVLVDVLAERGGDPPAYADQLARARDLQDAPGWLLALWQLVTFLGEEEFYLLVFPVLYWAVSRRVGVRVGAILLLTACVNGVGKLLVASPRPPYLDPSLERVSGPGFGIPSGHAQNAVAVWGLLGVALRRWWSVAAAVLLAAAIGWSRVQLGAHFLEDVLVGWAVGAVLLAVYLVAEGRVRAWATGLRDGAQVLAGLVASLVFVVPAVLLSSRLQGQHFPWPGMDDPVAVTGASMVVTPAATLAGLVTGLVLLRRHGGFSSDGALHRRFARVAVGLVGVIVLWQGLGAVFPGGEAPLDLALRYVRYGLVGAWVGGVAPLLFVRLGLADPAAPAPSPAVPAPDLDTTRA
jgi:glycerophosphoryl diester phosphodiesterase